jgi:cytochrome c
MLRSVPVIVAMAWLMAGAAQAQQAVPDLAKEKLCLSCHKVDAKLVGPAYRDVAAKYKGQADAEAKLVAKVKAGGKGVWGNVAMPANNLTDEEARTLVQWVLSQ